MGCALKHACVYLKKALYTYKICIIGSSQGRTFIWSCLPPVNAPTVVQPLMFNSGLLCLCLRLVSSTGLLDVIQYLAGFVCLYAAKMSVFEVELDCSLRKRDHVVVGDKKNKNRCAFWGQILKTQRERNGKGRGGASSFLQTALVCRVVSFFLLFSLLV